MRSRWNHKYLLVEYSPAELEQIKVDTLLCINEKLQGARAPHAIEFYDAVARPILDAIDRLAAVVRLVAWVLVLGMAGVILVLAVC